ncbi:MAG: hypothetical protein ACI4IS_02350 [Acutalibacteraceae bacterium]
MGYTDTPNPKSRPTKVSPFDPCKMILCFIEKTACSSQILGQHCRPMWYARGIHQCPLLSPA